MRKAMNEGRGDAVPIFLHDIPLVFERKIIPLDVSIISVSKLDQILVLRLNFLIINFSIYADLNDVVN